MIRAAAKSASLLSLGVLLAALATSSAQSPAPTAAANVFELRHASGKPAPEWEARTVTQREETTSTLYLEKSVLLDQDAIKAAWVEHDDPRGSGQDRVVVNVTLTAAGRQRFGEVTQRLVGQRLAFIVDGQVLSAPNINEPIRGGNLQLSGSFTEEEAQKIAAKLNAAAKIIAPVPPRETVFSGAPDSPTADAAAIPTGRGLFMTSGAPQPEWDAKSPANPRGRYGDTKTQAISALWQIEVELERAGLGLKDIVYLRAHLLADPMLESRFDYSGWYAAYEHFFGTKDNPHKPPRSTVGVAGLADPDWLIEIEAIAAYPAATLQASRRAKVESPENNAARIQEIMEAAKAGGTDTSDAAMQPTPKRSKPKPSSTPSRDREPGVGFMR